MEKPRCATAAGAPASPVGAGVARALQNLWFNQNPTLAALAQPFQSKICLELWFFMSFLGVQLPLLQFPLLQVSTVTTGPPFVGGAGRWSKITEINWGKALESWSAASGRGHVEV